MFLSSVLEDVDLQWWSATLMLPCLSPPLKKKKKKVKGQAKGHMKGRGRWLRLEMQSRNIWFQSPASTLGRHTENLVRGGRDRRTMGLTDQSVKLHQPGKESYLQNQGGQLPRETLSVKLCPSHTWAWAPKHACAPHLPTYSHKLTPYQGKESSRRHASEIEFPHKLNLYGNVVQSVDLI